MNKFIHSGTHDHTTIAFNPEIRKGVYRFEVTFQHATFDYSIGIADTTVQFAPGKEPENHLYHSKTVRYFRNGTFDHLTDNIVLGNATFNKDGMRVSAEVDMLKIPRKVTFFVDGVEQPNYVIGIPSAVRFWVRLIPEMPAPPPKALPRFSF
ncbi:MAG: hypothetical protein EZS28_026968 [Streblomastix strix]|uniref:Uncharacterized protein n=1 Tax=Streblomastix strix TaxID=222440 RepID=A0A5J4V565_9EUKA|nr:MAG: hypothetical protein EZS28_026968 [Streblomastix strix]